MSKIKYKGENTLEVISKELGGITKTMVNRLFSNALDKTRILTNGKTLENFSVEEENKLYSFLNASRDQALAEYIDLFYKANLDIYDFIMALKSKQHLTKGEMKIIRDDEIEFLTELKLCLLENDVQAAQTLLFEDLSKEYNVCGTFQSVISSFAFATTKRKPGRPRKEDANG